MSDQTAQPAAVPGDTSRADASERGRAFKLWTPIVTHTGVDYLSFIGVALMPLFAARHDLTPGDKALLLGLGPIASGLIQPLVAWFGDRFDTRMFGVAGVVVAAACVSMFGRIDAITAATGWSALLALGLLYFAATAGVGAFHPPAAAAVGHMAGRKRSVMLSVFFLAGMIGGIAGNVISPGWVRTFAAWSGREGQAAVTAGLESLTWLLLPGLVLAVVLGAATLGTPHRHADAHERHNALDKKEQRRRWWAFGVLYVGNAIRFPVNMALIYLFVEWSTRLAGQRFPDAADPGVVASSINGPMQAAMQVGMGGGGILLGLLLRPRLEKPAFVLLPILGAIPIVVMPYADGLAGVWAYIAAFAAAVVAGVCFGGMFPVSLSLGQRLLPHRTALASGMLLGGAWVWGWLGARAAGVLDAGAREGTLAGLLASPFGLTGPEGAVGLGLERTFLVVAAVLAFSGLFMLVLPGRLLREIDPH